MYASDHKLNFLRIDYDKATLGDMESNNIVNGHDIATESGKISPFR